MPDAADLTVYLTGAVALLTFFMARATRQQAVAATAQAEAAKMQVEAAHRPVLVPYQKAAASLRFRGGEIAAGSGPHIVENPPDRPDLPRYSAAFLAVENVGMGPALTVHGTFVGPRGTGHARFATEAIQAGAGGFVAFENWDGDSLGYTGNDATVSAVVEYSDVGGRLYRTSITFDIGSNAYRASVESMLDEPRAA